MDLDMLSPSQLDAIREFEREIFKNSRTSIYNSIGGDARFRSTLLKDIGDSDLVWDLGGYRGDWVSEVREHSNCEIWVFEPVPEFVKLLSERFAGDQKVRIFPFGLGETTRRVQLYLDGPGTSAFGSAVGQGESTGEIRSFGEFLKTESPRSVKLLKMNIEGGEYEFFRALNRTSFIEQISQFCVQFHEVNQNSDDELDAARIILGKTHHPTFMFDYVWEVWAKGSNAAALNSANIIRDLFNRTAACTAENAISKRILAEYVQSARAKAMDAEVEIKSLRSQLPADDSTRSNKLSAALRAIKTALGME